MLEPYVGKSAYQNHGRRVVEGQRFMQSASDIFLGWDRVEHPDGNERDFYVRQMWDGKFSPQIELMEPEVLDVYGEMCGSTLARAHARSGDRIAIASYLGSGDAFDRAIASFAGRLRRPEPARLRRGGRRREERRPRGGRVGLRPARGSSVNHPLWVRRGAPRRG